MFKRDDARTADGTDFRSGDYRGARFEGIHLEDADFRDADLRGVDFSGMDLSRADLRGADVRRVSFRDCVLCGAKLLGAQTELADFRGADLRQSDVEGTHLHGSKAAEPTEEPDKRPEDSSEKVRLSATPAEWQAEIDRLCSCVGTLLNATQPDWGVDTFADLVRQLPRSWGIGAAPKGSLLYRCMFTLVEDKDGKLAELREDVLNFMRRVAVMPRGRRDLLEASILGVLYGFK